MRDKVLIIDDEEVIRENLKKLLNLDGYEVFTAKNGQRGLDIFIEAKGEENTAIKVVLVDIKMPGMDGLEVLKRIKESALQTEVIIFTGHGGIESAIQALRRGAFDYITKPIEYDELALTILRALERYKMQKKLKKALKLFTISSELHRTLNIDEVYNIALDTITKVIGGENCSILIRNVNNNKLEIAACIGKKSKESPIVSYPLEVRNERIGEIHINSLLPQKDVLTEDDREILALLAKHIAVAITGVKLKNLSMENKQLTQDLEKANKELHKRLYELSTLYELSKEVSYTLDYKHLLRLIMDSLYKIIDYHVCASLILSKEEGKLNIRVAYPVSDSFIQDVRSKIIWSVTSLTGQTIKEEKLSVVMERGGKSGSEKREIKEKVSSFFNVPVISEEKLIGMIIVSSYKENAFTDADIRFIYTLANQASIAIERIRTVIASEESKMKAMVESMVEGVIMVDSRKKLVIINPAAKNLLGLNQDEQVTSKQLIQAFKEAGEERFFTKEIDFAEAEEKISAEIHITKPKPRTLYITQSLVNGIRGEKVGLVMSIRDITAEKEVDRMKTEFISTVSHELRTPLSITKEGISLVLDEIPGKINEKQEKILSIAKGNIDRLARIINSLLDISRIEAGKLELKRDLVNVKRLIEQVASSFKPKIKEKGLELKINLPQEEIEAYAEGDKIIEVLTNLLGNSLKFTEKGYLEISAKKTGKEIECTVKDTGIGLAKDDLSKVFGKFQQFGRVDSAGEKGTGLGLSISKGIVEAHHGKIWVESILGRGAKFIFTLPTYTTCKELFYTCINNGIKESIKKNSKMSLITVSAFELNKLKQKLSRQTLDSILKDIEEILRNNNCRAGDVVVREENRNIVLLSTCDKRNALKIKGRIKKILDDYLKDRNLTKEIEFKFGSATYPDDGLYAEKLLSIAEKT